MQNYICTTCGNLGQPKKETRGSTGLELILWLFLLIPGLIYSAWRLSSKRLVCRKCGNPTVIPLDTPQGKKLMQEHHKDQMDLVEKTENKKPIIKNDKRVEIGLWVIFLLLFVFLMKFYWIPLLLAITYSIVSRIKR